MNPPRYSVLIAAILLGWTHTAHAEEEPNGTTPDPKPGAFSKSYLNPPELQFSCAGTSDRTEERLAELLEKGEPDEQLAAARALWKGRSRRKATEVLKYLAGSPPG